MASSSDSSPGSSRAPTGEWSDVSFFTVPFHTRYRRESPTWPTVILSSPATGEREYAGHAAPMFHWSAATSKISLLPLCDCASGRGPRTETADDSSLTRDGLGRDLGSLLAGLPVHRRRQRLQRRRALHRCRRDPHCWGRWEARYRWPWRRARLRSSFFIASSASPSWRWPRAGQIPKMRSPTRLCRLGGE